jgi:hypothetical protein
VKPPPVVLLPALVLALAAAVPGEAQLEQSRCADCHFANASADWRWHLAEWDHSPHGRTGVGCERCHGGDPSTFESFRAHQGMLSSRNPASPVHPMNLPRTCGACHPGPFSAFQKSKHYELLREGGRDAPTCASCHGEVGAYLLSPKALFAECSGCHGPGKVAPNSDLPAEGRLVLTSVREVRESLDQARKLIRRVSEKERRARLELELEDAHVPLTEAVNSAHMFVFEPMRERLEMARKRAELLLEELANPTPVVQR